ncbi:hypothetical protein M426DRAFT_13988 [Hypoxylon sp. CI-4A]|nr:hypothetical protein M426DRAFT_13988 [Hypoxylon sp. CI-4A]
MSSGPCKECIAGDSSLFNGACTNCQYSSTASNCSFYTGKPRDQTKKRKRGAREEEDSSEEEKTVKRVTEKITTFNTRNLEIMANHIRRELDRRSKFFELPNSDESD